MQCLISPTPQAYFVLQRALNREFSWEYVFDSCYYLVKTDCQIHVKAHLRTSDSCLTGGVDWMIFPSQSYVNQSQWRCLSRPKSFTNAVQISEMALLLVEKASTAGEPVDDVKLKSFQQELNKHLDLTLGTDIRGRSGADASFNLALAGIDDIDLHNRLNRITRLEFDRVSRRYSRSIKSDLQIVEKLAASGARGEDAIQVYQTAAIQLARKAPHLDAKDLSTPRAYCLLANRPLLWLWRYSSGLSKVKFQKNSDRTTSRSNYCFDGEAACRSSIARLENRLKPVVIDIGCGFGVSLLGLASRPDLERAGDGFSSFSNITWSQCNYLGCDVSASATRFANGIARRWNLDHRVQYSKCSAETLIDSLHTHYPGQVAMILIQFPTPYRLDDNGGYGNQQLPSSVDDGFMVSPLLMEKVVRLIKSHSPHTILLVQSNCEDVAVRIKDMAVAAGLHNFINATLPRLTETAGETIPQRTQRWIAQGGERALGPQWWQDNPLPARCATETEIACFYQRVPVHRCMLTL